MPDEKNGKYGDAIGEAVRRIPPTLLPAALSIVAIVTVVWFGKELMEDMAIRYTEAQRERDRDLMQSLESRDQRFTRAIDELGQKYQKNSDDLLDRFERLQVETNRLNAQNADLLERAMERASQVIEKNTEAFVEFNLSRRQERGGS